MSNLSSDDRRPDPPEEVILGATEARARFAEVLGRVAYGGERIVIGRNGNKMGVLIPVEDYKRFRQWERREAR